MSRGLPSMARKIIHELDSGKPGSDHSGDTVGAARCVRHPRPFSPLTPCWTPPVWEEWRAKSEIRNPKSEIRNPKQIPMSKEANPQNRAAAGGLIGRVLRICHLNLVLVSDFEFRISD